MVGSSSTTTASSLSGQRETDQLITSGLICKDCRKHGHVITECWALQKKNQKEVKPTAVIAPTPVVPTQPKRAIPETKGIEAESDPVMDEYKPFMSEGFVTC